MRLIAKLFLILIFVTSCKSQNPPMFIAYKANATVMRYEEGYTVFQAKNERYWFKAKDNNYKKGDEYLIKFKILGHESEIVLIDIMSSQSSKKQWYQDELEGDAYIKKLGGVIQFYYIN